MTTPFELSSRLVDEMVGIDPLFATALGVRENASEWGDTGLAGADAQVDLCRRALAGLRTMAEHPDPKERLAVRVLTASLADRIAEHEHGDHLTDLSHMASSFQMYTRVFDAMPKESADDWDAIVARLGTIDRAFTGLKERLSAGTARGIVVAQRQVVSVIAQAQQLAAAGGAFDVLASEAPQPHQPGAREAAAAARAATMAFAGWLTTEYLPHAGDEDGAGEATYRRKATRFVGIDVDPVEAYEWGWAEFHQLREEMDAVGRSILPGGSFAEVTNLLDTDPERAAPTPEAFIEFIQRRQELALTDLEGSHFDVAPPLRTVTVRLAPPGSPLGAYYMRPSEDFSRPGGIWYAIGDQTTFPLYHHVSTAYHEGFPGHHLQVGTAMVHEDRISRAQRVAIWLPGYGEGWALYAERLMQELGYYELPDYHFGMLAKHLYRATRVVVDIGLHLGLEIPAHAPLAAGQQWSFDIATDYMRTYGFRTPDQATGEVLRYLGWPGQATAYKLGEREILAIRRDARTQHGAAFDLKRFHDRLIGHGAMRFDTLRDVVLGDAGL